MLSHYNQRMNTQLIECCNTLSQEFLVKETGSFFNNIIGYWNHLIFGDLILLRRFASNNIANLTLSDLEVFPQPQSPRDLYHTGLADIASLRKQLDKVIIKFFENLSDSECLEVITYKTTEGDTITKCISDICQHLFLHQTHHRGQLTCILSQFNVDFGCTDLPVLVPEGSCTQQKAKTVT